MLKIENVSTFGWKAAIRGMRNPKNSWAQIDSAVVNGNCFVVGNNDYDLMYKLASAGTDHGKFMRMIHMQCDVTAPLYWWKEADQYKVGTVTDSCSTMHKIHAKEFTLDDFSHEHLNDESTEYLSELVDLLNRYRELFLKDKNKSWWWQMIQLLPSSYNQLRTWDLNYAVLQNIYHARRNHKLDEWHTFCDWIESLPYSDLITGITGKAVL
jgi:hypothetical protein|nr:MAG TPA: hypothetical protein [Caudoviricetes sp.]